MGINASKGQFLITDMTIMSLKAPIVSQVFLGSLTW